MVTLLNISEAFETSLLNVRHERFYLYIAILAVKSHYVFAHMDDRRHQQCGLTLLLALLMHPFLRTQVEQRFTAAVLEALVVELPTNIHSDISKIVHCVFICLHYTAREFQEIGRNRMSSLMELIEAINSPVISVPPEKLQEIGRNRMSWSMKLIEAINSPVISVPPEKYGLRYQILALKCYYVIGNLEISRIDRQNLTLFFTLLFHCVIRPFWPLQFPAFIFEALILTVSSAQPEYEWLLSFVMLLLGCIIHPVLEFVIDLWLICSFIANTLLTIQRSPSYRNYGRWELIVMTYLLCDLGLKGLFDTLMLLTSWFVFLKAVHRIRNDALFITFIVLQTVGELFGNEICDI
ncbi:hypothetical protein HNY73_020988 [Argiope bruennichi]|uniref:Uncharacterized protein n=1 Tax=Argiope bruennichi TaxID=94029 RepID=A0A8T0E9S7_ARGBR|nr:hypothetical protein HNY73_020988 [Argiope bruennichi]